MRERHLRCQRKSWHLRRGQPAAAQPPPPPPSTRAVPQTRGPAVARPHRGEGQPALRGPDDVVARGRTLVCGKLLGEGEGSGNQAARAIAPAKQEQDLPLTKARGDGGGKTARRRVESWGSHRGGLRSPTSCPSAHNRGPAVKGRANESREGQSPAQGIEQRAHRGGHRTKRRRRNRVRAIARLFHV